MHLFYTMQLDTIDNLFKNMEKKYYHLSFLQSESKQLNLTESI